MALAHRPGIREAVLVDNLEAHAPAGPGTADDSEDRLAPIQDQLRWLREAGFANVDRQWRWHGFALMVGERLEAPTRRCPSGDDPAATPWRPPSGSASSGSSCDEQRWLVAPSETRRWLGGCRLATGGGVGRAVFVAACGLAALGLVGCDLGVPATAYGAAGTQVAAGDVNGDGHTDFFVGMVPGTLAGNFLVNDGAGAFGSIQMPFVSAPAPISGGTRTIRLADVDSDGFDDMVWAIADPKDPSSDEFSLAVLPNDGDGGFGAVAFGPALTLADGANSWLRSAVGDVSGDGHPDVVMYATGQPVSTWLGDGAGGFGEVVQTTLSQWVVGGVQLADLDADGRDDLVLAGATASSEPVGIVHVGLSDGTGAFPDPVAYPTAPQPSVGGVGAIAAGDIDADGDQDLVGPNVASGAPTASLTLLLNNGDGTFALPVERTVPLAASQVSTADFDSDGYVDLLLVSDTEAKILFGDGTTRFPRERVLASHGLVSVGELSGDAEPDITFRAPDTLTVFLNAL